MKRSKQTKRALTSSVLALVLCFVMLLGTTFAWFTDNASTNVNKVQAGTLDVALEMKQGDNWVSAEGKTLNFKAADNNTNILWEPGCTYELPTLRIVNSGNLALKYEVVITGINGNEKLNEVIEWKYSAMFANGTYSYPADMEGNVLMTGVMYPGDESSQPDWMPASGTFKIIGHMKETAGNTYQGLSIDGISITVVATQAQYEYDSNGNTYDKNATYPTIVPAAGLDTSENNEFEADISDYVGDEAVTNGYWIKNGNYTTTGTLATFDASYDSVLVSDTSISCKTLFKLTANNTIILSDCNITLAEGGKLVEANGVGIVQICFHNVKINGVEVTASNVNDILETYCTGLAGDSFIPNFF